MIRTAAEALRNRLVADGTKVQATVDIKSVLKELYEPTELTGLDSKPASELFEMLQDKIEASRNDEALRKESDESSQNKSVAASEDQTKAHRDQQKGV